MLRNRWKILIAATLAVMCGTTAAALALSDTGSPGPPGFTPITYTPSTGASAGLAGITGTSMPAVLSELETRLGTTGIVGAEVRSIAASEAAGVPGGTTLVVTVGAGQSHADGIKATWEAELLAGALREVANERALGSALDNFETLERSSDGSIVPVDSGFGNVALGQLFDTSSDAVIESRLRARLTSVGLRPVSISFMRGLQAAPVVVAEADDPQAVVTASEDATFWSKMLGTYQAYEGYYLELRDGQGHPFLISTAAHRAGSSSGWIRSDLRPSINTSPVPTGSDGG
jgi:hypothetical protein